MAMTNDAERSPNPIDIHVGRRVRQRRKTLGVTQERLAEDLGLTFQQVQKYERGANRVSASKLYEIARSLRTSIGYFFEGLADPSTAHEAPGMAEPSTEQFVTEFLMTPEGLELAELFPKIRKGRVRRRVLDLVRSMVEEEAGGDDE
ncbi:MAG TPA: helix-turn-helix transcriptional regulator [Caulobacteraceae bacterium]